MSNFWQTYNVMGRKTSSVHDDYRLSHPAIWRSGNGITMYKCTSYKTGDKYACKSIPKTQFNTVQKIEAFRTQISIMHHLANCHENIVSLKDVHEDESHVHVVMELCSGGELSVKSKSSLSEREAANVTRIIVEVIQTCHLNGVMLRGLQVSDFLFARKNDCLSLRLVYFKYAVFFKPGQKFNEVVGRASSVAPEVHLGYYGPEVDIWSVGVILYQLLCSVEPFAGASAAQIRDAMLMGDIDFYSFPWPQISRSARHLIRHIFGLRSSNRFAAQDISNNRWIKENQIASNTAISDDGLPPLNSLFEGSENEKDDGEEEDLYLKEFFEQITTQGAVQKEVSNSEEQNMHVKELLELIKTQGAVQNELLSQVRAQAQHSAKIEAEVEQMHRYLKRTISFEDKMNGENEIIKHQLGELTAYCMEIQDGGNRVANKCEALSQQIQESKEKMTKTREVLHDELLGMVRMQADQATKMNIELADMRLHQQRTRVFEDKMAGESEVIKQQLGELGDHWIELQIGRNETVMQYELLSQQIQDNKEQLMNGNEVAHNELLGKMDAELTYMRSCQQGANAFEEKMKGESDITRKQLSDLRACCDHVLTGNNAVANRCEKLSEQIQENKEKLMQAYEAQIDAESENMHLSIRCMRAFENKRRDENDVISRDLGDMRTCLMEVQTGSNLVANKCEAISHEIHENKEQLMKEQEATRNELLGLVRAHAEHEAKMALELTQIHSCQQRTNVFEGKMEGESDVTRQQLNDLKASWDEVLTGNNNVTNQYEKLSQQIEENKEKLMKEHGVARNEQIGQVRAQTQRAAKIDAELANIRLSLQCLRAFEDKREGENDVIMGELGDMKTCWMEVQTGSNLVVNQCKALSHQIHENKEQLTKEQEATHNELLGLVRAQAEHEAKITLELAQIHSCQQRTNVFEGKMKGESDVVKRQLAEMRTCWMKVQTDGNEITNKCEALSQQIRENKEQLMKAHEVVRNEQLGLNRAQTQRATKMDTELTNIHLCLQRTNAFEDKMKGDGDDIRHQLGELRACLKNVQTGTNQVTKQCEVSSRHIQENKEQLMGSLHIDHLENMVVQSSSSNEKVTLPDRKENTVVQSLSPNATETLTSVEENMVVQSSSPNKKVTLRNMEENMVVQSPSLIEKVTLPDMEENVVVQSQSSNEKVTLPDVEENMVVQSPSPIANETLTCIEENMVVQSSSPNEKVTLPDMEENMVVHHQVTTRTEL